MDFQIYYHVIESSFIYLNKPSQHSSLKFLIQNNQYLKYIILYYFITKSQLNPNKI